MLEIKPVTATEPIKEIRKIKKEDAHPSSRQSEKKQPELKEDESGQLPTHIDELV